MKTFFKWVLILGLIVLAAGGGYYVYDNYIAKNNVRSTFAMVPQDAVFIIETSNLTEGWNAINESNIWTNLMNNAYFRDINEYVELLNKFLKNNAAIEMILKDRPMLISAHMISAVDYDFLFVVDLQSSKTLSGTLDKILQLVDGYEIKKRKFNEQEIIEFIDKKDPSGVILFSTIDNLLLMTFSGDLMEKTIEKKDVGYWEKNKQYQNLSGELSARKLFKFYFNYRMLPAFISVYSHEMDEYTGFMAKSLTYSAFDVNLENNRLSFNGFTALDSMPSYFTALSDVKPGKIRAYEVISDQTAFYLSIGFKNYNMFFQSLKDQYASGNAETMEDYAGNVKMVEKLLGIDVQKDFFDWIGEEIALVKLLPDSSSRMEDLIVAIHSSNINDAREGLDRIAKKIRRVSLKYEVNNYKNFELHILERKGIFKLFFGKLFEKLEKPYFTYIEDFVIFSNSEAALKEIIDDYLKGHTLSHQKEFMEFKDLFEEKSNVSLFVQMPKMYPTMYAFSTEETRNSMQDNKDIVLSFNRIGFQLVSSGEIFNTRFISDHNADAAMNEALENFEKKTTDDLVKEEFDSLRFKIILPDSVPKPDGSFKTFYPDNSTVKFEGKIANKLPAGIWRTYYESGNLKSTVNYKNGKVDGIAYFYFDDNKETKLAEVVFKDDVVQDIYQEFYENGAQKAKLTYENGKLNGDAQYFYATGRIKMQGKYKDNEKKGKWVFYSENGEIIDKERMKRNRKQNT
ncbi:MAG: DUF3352 domain-containing protein [Bacteroidales bacterium]